MNGERLSVGGIEYILEGLEEALELERELGVRSVEIDRALLAPIGGTVSHVPPAPHVPLVNRDAVVARATRETRATRGAESKTTAEAKRGYDFVFLHDRALTAAATAMMAKIVTAMGATPETAPIVFTGTRPKAKVYVVLGGNALKKWFPRVPGAPGQWIRAEGAPNVLVTYSPHYILRFVRDGEEPSPALVKMKREMWTSIKGVLRRVSAL